MNRPTAHPLSLAAIFLATFFGAGATPVLAEIVETSTDRNAGVIQRPAEPPVSAAQGFWSPDQDVPCLTPEQHAEIRAYLAAARRGRPRRARHFEFRR
jgi:hypothetical protein